MIKSLKLTNFRGFKDHVVEFSPFSLLVGQNNAGKTTIIEALRILSVAQAKVANAKFMMAPSEFAEHFTGAIFRFSLDTLDFDDTNVHYLYQDEQPAQLSLRYKNNCIINVYLGADKADKYCQYLAAGGKKVNNRSAALNPKFRRVFVMPPIGSLLSSETERNLKYLYKNINGYLSYRQIRNQMFEMPEEFAVFRERLEATWDHLKVEDIVRGRGDLNNEYHLNLRDGTYPAEVARLGSGLQAWIQTLWFLARVDDDAIVVLDEPDVYLHADLQKKLIRVLASMEHRQTVVATHSIEMISDVSPDELIEVRKREPRSKPISSVIQVQAVLNQMGTSHHLQLSKLGHTGVVLFVEGKDHALLSKVANKLGDAFSKAFETIPKFPIGGMGNWQRAAMTAKVLTGTSESVRSVLVIDRDYFGEDYLEKIRSEAQKSSLDVRVWQKKEIENYFLDLDIIFNHVSSSSTKVVKRSDLEAQLNTIVGNLGIESPAQIAQNLQAENKKLAIPTAMNIANDFINLRKAAGLKDCDLVSGKQVFTSLNAFCNLNYGVSFSATTICRQMDLKSVPREVLELVKDVCPATEMSV